ncbi:MAG: hypothetical protein Q7K34_04790 [archaeon]|nr:hypothetical protein [archaeon]
MRAVADASVLIFFSKMKKLDLLAKLFQEIVVTDTVFDEIMAGKSQGFLDCLEVEKMVKNNEIRLIKTKEKAGSGEDSTIMAAKEKKITVVLMDDYAGIRKAAFWELTAYSCPFILLKALKEKQVSKTGFGELLDKLLSENYFISPRLLKKILELSEKL